MRWPSWSSSDNAEDRNKARDEISWIENLNATDWSHYTDPRTVIPTILLTSTCLFSVHIYRTFLRRIPQATDIKPSFWRRRSLFGKVGDVDNFRIFHTPGGRLAGCGWLPWRRIPISGKALKDKTVSECLYPHQAASSNHRIGPCSPCRS